jgi:hypothetical protein
MKIIHKRQTKMERWGWIILVLTFFITYNLQNRYQVIDDLDIERQIVLDKFTGEILVKNLKDL